MAGMRSAIALCRSLALTGLVVGALFAPLGVSALPGRSSAAPVTEQVPADPLARRLLDRHNGERLRIGVAPLVWNRRLAEDAARWAQRLAASGTFDHAARGSATAAEPYRDAGENLWAGTRGAYAPEEMVDSWIAERAYFRAGRFPQVVTAGDWSAVGHYTQLIWPATREVGCAIVAATREDILVCRYHPAGNVMGDPVGYRGGFAPAARKL